MRTLTLRATNNPRPHYSHIVDLFNLNNHDVNYSKFDIDQIISNTIVLDKAGNRNALLFKEALLIKSHKPSLNNYLNLVPSTSYKEFLTPF